MRADQINSNCMLPSFIKKMLDLIIEVILPLCVIRHRLQNKTKETQENLLAIAYIVYFYTLVKVCIH